MTSAPKPPYLQPSQPRLSRSVLLIFFWVAAFFSSNPAAHGFDWTDLMDISSAYFTHLTLHELGHQVVADEVGAQDHKMSFLAQKNGQFYLGLSTYEAIPEKSVLPYAVGGERMASLTFEYGLESYRQNPTTFNKALMFFSTVDFLGYTLLANYVNPTDSMYDPTLIRQETGASKELILSLVLTKSLVNAYRVFNPECRWMPIIETDLTSARFMLSYHF
jgi:hypothetical protein